MAPKLKAYKIIFYLLPDFEIEERVGSCELIKAINKYGLIYWLENSKEITIKIFRTSLKEVKTFASHLVYGLTEDGNRPEVKNYEIQAI